MTWRAEARRALEEEVFDLLVVGGGITGSGIARDASGRGLKVALVDAGDIGGATSSRSSRLVHGGLRYLETFEFGLVFEALRERRRLLELAPHLVHPLPFLFPVFRGDDPGLPKLAAGMLLYEGLSLFRSPGRQRFLTRGAALEIEPKLRAMGLVGGALYHDAQVDDARLTLSVARGAHESGAVLISHAGVKCFDRGPDQVTTVTIEDRLNTGTFRTRARLVLNAAGPWSDRVRQLADPSATPRLRTTKGVHLLFDRERIGNRNAIIFRSVIDDRVMFVLPWGRFTYVGTTDTEFDGDPADVVADASDIRYLLDSANHIYPDARLTAEDIVSSWAGVRPLLAPAEESGASVDETSREHAIWRDPSGLLNVAGGKLTTFREMAAEAASVAAGILKGEYGISSGDFHTEFAPIPGAPELGVPRLLADLDEAAKDLGLPEDTLKHLIGRYGKNASALIALIRSEPSLGDPILPELDYLMAESVYAVQSEWALTLEDVMRRRLQLFYEARDGGLSVAARVAAQIGPLPELRWDAVEIKAQIDRYSDTVTRTRPAENDSSEG
ncbi:MAG: glycerol-3-phosphate dehydrogenase/oxidase [Gemmatimonadota bacterium]|jgi:glycerol-3-phosphate dehydrogenase|nr:glycerol-3-phosphate dehydrogenase/oxidase [Gemmatimonadota bacterium]